MFKTHLKEKNKPVTVAVPVVLIKTFRVENRQET